MAAELLLCVSQNEAETPYKFKLTNISVFSFEEALYHCYYYWKQSIDDFVSDEFLTWVSEVLGLSFLAAKIKEISRIYNLSDKLVGFLSLTDYFDNNQLMRLRAQVADWEQRLEWQKLKERADYLMHNGEPEKAYAYYKRALEVEENKELLNNAALALMQLEYYDEAIVLLRRAYEASPTDINIIEVLAESFIYNHEFENALKLLAVAEKINRKNSVVQYLYGELNFEMGNYRVSIDYFEAALALNHEDHYIYRLADVYVKLRQYEKALETLDTIGHKEKDYLVKLAEIHAKSNNLPAAVRGIERALATYKDSVRLWTMLASYHRMDYDLVKANNAIIKALSIAPEDERAKLESARIKKCQGKIKDYQVVLKDILAGFKKRYREEH